MLHACIIISINVIITITIINNIIIAMLIIIITTIIIIIIITSIGTRSAFFYNESRRTKVPKLYSKESMSSGTF